MRDKKYTIYFFTLFFLTESVYKFLSTELLFSLFRFVPMIKGLNSPIHFVPCFHSLFSENYNLRERWVHSFSFALFFR